MLDTSLDSFNFYFLMAVFQGVVLASVIAFRKPKSKPNIFLGLLIFLFSMSLLHLILEESFHAFNAKFPVPMEFSFAYGPLAYLHVLTIKNPRLKLRFRDYLHFLPSLFFDVFLFTSFFLYVGSHMEWGYGHIEEIQATALIIAALGLIQLSIYTIFIYKESRTKQLLDKEFDAIRKWLKTIVLAWSVVIGFLLVAVPMGLLNIEQLDDNSYLLYKPLGAIIGLCIYGLGYLYVLKYQHRLREYADRLQRIKFTEKEMQHMKEELQETIQKEKLYENQSLTVGSLARRINWPINDISVIINEAMNTNFNDLINQYRIQAFMTFVNKPEELQKYSILGLAEEVGFSSKASFYRAFKKETGSTPSEFLRSAEVQS